MHCSCSCSFFFLQVERVYYTAADAQADFQAALGRLFFQAGSLEVLEPLLEASRQGQKYTQLCLCVYGWSLMHALHALRAVLCRREAGG